MLNVHKSKLSFFIVIFIVLGKSSVVYAYEKITSGHHRTDEYLSKYIVSIRVISPEIYFGSNHYCGGSIFKPNIIVTAAHCCMNRDHELRDANNLMIIAGSKRRLKREKFIQEIRVSHYLHHPRFDPETSHADVALFFLRDNIKFNGPLDLGLVPLVSETPKEDWNCTALGFGAVIFNGPYSDELVYADVTIASRDSCSYDYQLMPRGHICAVDATDDGQDACEGDSGGPLFCNGDQLTGIVSYGFGCGGSAPGYYTNVYYWQDWIFENRGSKKIGSLVLLLSVIYIYALLN